MASKKITSYSGAAAPGSTQSPGQKTSETSISGEKLMTEFKRMMQEIHEDLKGTIGGLTEKIEKLTEEMKEMKELMENKEQRLQKVENKIEVIETRVMDLSEFDKRQERTIIMLESDKAEFYLRFQNVAEEKGENLAELMAGLLAAALEEDRNYIFKHIDEAFRVYTRYAMRNKLPREVHVRFTKKTMRIDLLQRLRNCTMKYKEKEIVTLKQVPQRVRELRKEYQFLTKKLIERGVNFRWLIPEGIILTWNQQRLRLDTVNKAEAFYRQNFVYPEEGMREREEREMRPQKETTEEHPKSQILEKEQLQQEKEQEGILPIDTKDPKEIRKTRSAKALK